MIDVLHEAIAFLRGCSPGKLGTVYGGFGGNLLV